MVKNTVIIVLSILLIFASRKKLKFWMKKLAKKLIPPKYYQRLKSIIKGDSNEEINNKGNLIYPHPIFPIIKKDH